MALFKKMTAVSIATFGALLGLNSVNAQDAEPKLVEGVAPVYPRAAERREIEGYVVVKLAIDGGGKVAGVEVVEATPPGVFDKAAMKAAEQWQFESGKPHEGLVKKLAFKLSDS